MVLSFTPSIPATSATANSCVSRAVFLPSCMLSYRSRFTRLSCYLCCNVVNLAPRRTRRKERGRTRARSEPYAPECVEVEFYEVRRSKRTRLLAGKCLARGCVATIGTKNAAFLHHALHRYVASSCDSLRRYCLRNSCVIQQGLDRTSP